MGQEQRNDNEERAGSMNSDFRRASTFLGEVISISPEALQENRRAGVAPTKKTRRDVRKPAGSSQLQEKQPITYEFLEGRNSPAH
jgi:hypothetical protein